MALKITRPLYSDTVTGKIKGLGTFRQNKDGTSHLYNLQMKRKRVPSPSPGYSENIGKARREHAQGPRMLVIIYGEKRHLLIQPWGEFWRQYIIDHGLTQSGN